MAGGKPSDDLFVCGEEIVLAEFFGEHPSDLLEGDWLDRIVCEAGGKEANFEEIVAVSVLVLDAAEFDGFGENCAKFFTEFAGESGFGGFRLFHFATREFPLEG